MDREVGLIAATLAVLIAYVVAAWARRTAGGKWSWNVLVITQGVHARASLSKLQFFFFTMVVLWGVVAVLTWTGKLAGLSSDVVVLLGIGAAGTAGGKVAAIAKNRLGFDNWAWLIRKKWIKESVEPGLNTRKPEFGDLLSSHGELDISKFQLFVFSLVVGAGLIYFVMYSDTCNLISFEVPGEYLTLMGVSQAAYIGGKAVGPSTKADLDKKLNEVRTLETAFVMAVERSWAEKDPGRARDADAARSAAPEAYRAYRMRAEEAAEMVGKLIDKVVTATKIEPSIPT